MSIEQQYFNDLIADAQEKYDGIQQRFNDLTDIFIERYEVAKYAADIKQELADIKAFINTLQNSVHMLVQTLRQKPTSDSRGFGRP